MKTVAEIVAHELKEAGVDRVFGLPGGEVLYLMEALRNNGIEFILCRHEADAGIMASVYGKLKRVPGVALATLGPGAANFMLALANSILDREPLLAITAQIPVASPTTHTHQRLPLLECYGPITKFSAAVDGMTTRRTLRHAIQRCMEEPSGPVFLTLSAEDAVAPNFENEHAIAPQLTQDWTNPSKEMQIGNPQATAEQLRRRLAEAERPLIMLGIGVDQRNSQQLRHWLNNWKLPVAVTPKVKGIVDEFQDNFVGVIGGMSIDSLMCEALKHSDLLVGFGFDPVEVDKTWHAELPILWLLESPLALQVVPRSDLLVADHRAVLNHLSKSEPPRSWGHAFREFTRRRNEYYLDAGTETSAPLSQTPVAIVRTLAESLPPDTIVTTDVGSHKYLFGQFWPSRQPETFFMSNGLSGMGYGLPAAIGAKLARPNATVMAIVGDGGFSMNSQELETAERVGAPIIVLVLADRSYSLIHHSQKSKQLPNYGVDFNPIDSILIAEACGVEGVRVESRTELAHAVKVAAAHNRSLVVEVSVDLSAYNGLV